MTGSVSTRYAFRSLRRNFRRTLLSVIGVGIGVGVGLFAISFIRGEETMMVGAAAAGGIGHLRVAAPGWSERREDTLRLDDWGGELERLRGTEGVRIAAPTARTAGLLGLGTRSAYVTLTGVDASVEQEALRYVRNIVEGRYLEPAERGAIVLGRAPARRLDAEIDDELVVTTVDAAGEMQSRLLVLVGIAETGSRDIDMTIAHVALEDLEALSGRPGAADISLLLDDVHVVDAMAIELAGRLHGDNELLTWKEVSPELRAGLEGDQAFYDLSIFIVLLVVLLGVASAQLTGVLERRKEFAVLAAIGMRRLSLVKIVLIEGFALGLLSALAAMAWVAPLLWKLARDGVDMSSMMGSEEGFAFGNVLIDPMLYPDFGVWLIPAAFFLAMVATITASLYPAWFASRSDPATALRVDR